MSNPRALVRVRSGVRGRGRRERGVRPQEAFEAFQMCAARTPSFSSVYKISFLSDVIFFTIC